MRMKGHSRIHRISVVTRSRFAVMAIVCALSSTLISFAPSHAVAQIRLLNPRSWFKPSPPKTNIRSPEHIASQVSLEELRTEIGARVSKVEEFRFIAEWAKKEKIQVWLFGGTAAAFAHYVHWDLLREKGDTRFNPSAFDYNYTNIFRSNQDLDIVIDGSADKAADLERQLREKFSYLQGNKTAWEVRLLKETSGTKEAVLGNPDFANQHTDSNSVGMVSISDSTSSAAVRDLRDWDNLKDSAFLNDIHDFTLHYYWSSKHETTNRYKEGKNPSIISVVRYFIKAFQYELSIPEESLAYLEREIRSFNSSKKYRDPYVDTWLEKNAPKLIQNAVNIEYAWNTLEAVGLREKLIERSNAEAEGSMGWWLSREPLRTKKLGSGFGKTAKELGIDIVAHETRSYEAWESITRAHTGDPNVLKSRDGKVGEGAAYGDGFYTLEGDQGAVGSNITIRFRVHPDAREGTDFFRPKGAHGMVVFTNRAALQVIPETYNFDLVSYLELISGGFILDKKNEGAIYRLNRRIQFSLTTLTDSDFDRMRAVLERLSKSGDFKGYQSVVTEMVRLLEPAMVEKMFSQMPLVPPSALPEELKSKVVAYYTSDAARLQTYLLELIRDGSYEKSVDLHCFQALESCRKHGLSDAVLSEYAKRERERPEGTYAIFLELYRVANDRQRAELLRVSSDDVVREFKKLITGFRESLVKQLAGWIKDLVNEEFWVWPPQSTPGRLKYGQRPAGENHALEINMKRAPEIITVEACMDALRKIISAQYGQYASFDVNSVDRFGKELCEGINADLGEREIFAERKRIHTYGSVEVKYDSHQVGRLCPAYDIAHGLVYRRYHPNFRDSEAWRYSPQWKFEKWGPSTIDAWIREELLPPGGFARLESVGDCSSQLKK